MTPSLKGIFGKGNGRRRIRKDAGAPITGSRGLTASHSANRDGAAWLVKGYASLVQELVTAWKRNNSHDNIVERLSRAVKAVRGRSSTLRLDQLREVLGEMDALVTAVDEKRLPITKEFIKLALEFGDFIDEALRSPRLPEKVNRRLTDWRDRYQALMLSVQPVAADSDNGTKSQAHQGVSIQRTTEPTATPAKSREIWPDNLAVAAAAARISELEGKLEALHQKHQELVDRIEQVSDASAPDDEGRRYGEVRGLSSGSDVEDWEKVLFLERGRRPPEGPRRAK